MNKEQLAQFILRCLSKMAEQDMEPVAWYTDDHLSDKSATTYDPIVAERWYGKGWPTTRLYTETQLIAAQQRVAEACAKAVFEQAKYFGYNVHAEAVRDAVLNNWRECM